MKLDIQKLKSALKSVAADIREQKAILRESGQPRKTFRTFATLARLKSAATLLCSIRAHHRGKIHLKDSSLEQQAKLIGNSWEAYKREEQAA